MTRSAVGDEDARDRGRYGELGSGEARVDVGQVRRESGQRDAISSDGTMSPAKAASEPSGPANRVAEHDGDVDGDRARQRLRDAEHVRPAPLRRASGAV